MNPVAEQVLPVTARDSADKAGPREGNAGTPHRHMAAPDGEVDLYIREGDPGAMRGVRFINRTFEQPAFHGSPHVLDKVSTEHTGSGGGAQACGDGLYRAAGKTMANHHRGAFTEGRATSGGERLPKRRTDGKPSDPERALPGSAIGAAAFTIPALS